jgi:ethanolamine utilization protein EutP (predicted NTPase)
VEKVEGVSVSDEAMAPLKFQEEVIIGFKEMNDPETMDPGFSRVFLDHHVGCVTPARNGNATEDNNVHEL